MPPTSGSGRTNLQIYRDTLRLIKHIAGARSAKATALKALAAKQFRENASLRDPDAIAEARNRAEVMLSNYVLYEQSRKDSRFAAATQTGIQMPEIVEEEDGMAYEVRPEMAVTRAGSAGSDDDALESGSETEYTEVEVTDSEAEAWSTEDDSDWFTGSESESESEGASSGSSGQRRVVDLSPSKVTTVGSGAEEADEDEAGSGRA
ncbi:hypothetical protein FNF31_04371 [Cafeteria roenbergensis]|uniref:Uncharacterized protein n=1 Tax=Cafeteria roenbergensis TaxID=33653 RepID=A0A5A8DA77_CAFRO|nr:hypothetical protein FNF31_04371 [Cafeteria roenbergensis]KAA0161190.1 hypothetical protein FNF28_05139 [Cafeteria roenbergensis]